MGEGECEPIEPSKKGRHRKKLLYNSILQQMEFYFSDSNLSKDRFLSKLILEDPYIDIKVFLSFNKIRKLNCTIEDIRKAISKSDLIELSEDREKICRKIPIKKKENVDECTIYVENIKTDANHEWLSQVFSDFGNVTYVSIPKYKQNKGNKGFAFVEFDTEKEANSALNYFESIGCKMPSDTNPEDLKSIVTFQDDKSSTPLDQNKMPSDTNPEDLKKTFQDKSSMPLDQMKTDSKEYTDKSIESEVSRKRKLSADGKQEKKLKTETDIDKEDTTKTKTENIESEDTESKRKKKHKKDKKKNYIKELGLQILSKRDWKRMRNRYLDLQRKKMKEFKHYLQKQKISQKYDKLKKSKDDNPQPLEEEKSTEECPTKLEFIPGVIVKLKLPEPCLDVKKLKSEIKMVSPEVKYVDIPLPAASEEVYIRFSNNQSAKEFCQQEFIGERVVLENQEERSYWDKIRNDRTIKFTRCLKKQRGRDKLLKKAEKERAKHLRFDEGD